MKFTPTQAAILRLLSDGLPHNRYEIHRLLPDDLSQLTALQMHISRIRKQLRPSGQDILCTLVNRRICYQHVRLLASANDGRS